MNWSISSAPTRALALLAVTGALISVTTGLAAAAPAAPGTPTLPAAPKASAPAAAEGRPALGSAWKPGTAKGAAQKAGQVVPGQVVLQLSPQTALTSGKTRSTAPTSSSALNTALAGLHATALHPLTANLVVADLADRDSAAAATRLAAVDGVVSAEPNRYVSGMSSGSTRLPAAAATTADADAAELARQAASAPSTAQLPTNYGLTSSLESWLNAGGVDAMGAYTDLTSRYGQLPGTGEIITNVSIGDLTDQSMADAGDTYVESNGPTTVVRNGQRYLDIPSMPLIPTWTADASGTLDPTGSTENQDATDGEILLDFGVMSPLPHDQQRSENTGDGLTDLLGIAPGASYRLVVPSEPTMDQVGTALLAAARQTPRPDVINASLGFGTDTTGFAGRYLEDDPAMQSIIATIVHRYGITVTVSANDGTRLYTPASVGPDGGSTPTDVTRNASATTSVDDDAASTTPSEVLDSGAIAAGGSTTDDTLADGASAAATVAETRISGSGDFSSGFGTRINLSAPSDNIPAFEHSGSTAQSVGVFLSGGTSASAPEIAAAAAVVQQTARLTGRTLTPNQIRDLLVRTARPVGTPAQIDQDLQVGPQLDLTAAVESLLPTAKGAKGGKDPVIDRISVAHRVTIGGLGGTFVEYTDPGAVDLAGPVDGDGNATGQGLSGPVTIAADISYPNKSAGREADYTLTVGRTTFHSDTPSIRATPAQLLTAAGLPVVAATARTVDYTFTVRDHDGRSAEQSGRLTFTASDGTVTEAAAPTIRTVARAGDSVTVHYDLSGVRNVSSPELVLSTVGHWNPALAPLFNPAWTAQLSPTEGTVTIPASAFTGGGGIYGVGIIQDNEQPQAPVYGEFAPIRVQAAAASSRPDAPTLGAPGQPTGHTVTVTRSAPGFTLHYSTDNARGAVLEISAPAPTLYGSLNTFTAQNGVGRDGDGFDTGSVVYRQLPGRSGTVELDALKLGLATSVQYNVRIVPVDKDGTATGQASPSSALIVDDGPAPGGGTVTDFVTAGTDSVAAVSGSTGSTGTSVRHYDPATGRYGAVITSDTTATAGYGVLGVDPVAHTVLLTHWVSSKAQRVEVWDLGSDTEIGSPITLTSSQDILLGGRVDPARHRAALLVWAKPGNVDQLIPLDLSTATAGSPVALDTTTAQKRGAYFYGLDVDRSTGLFQVAHLGGGGLCFGPGTAQVADVDLDTGTVTDAPTSATRCGVQFASSQNGGSSWLLGYTAISVNFPGTTGLVGFDESTLAPAGSLTQRQESPLAFAVDSVHNVAVVAYGTPLGKVVLGQPFAQTTDSNAMSQLDVVDLSTGAVLKTLSDSNFIQGFGSAFDATTEPAVQLDPATRTGWTYGPDGTQIQQFSY
ncbi:MULTISPECIES: S8 family serine peptidase [Streptacidiphilus]|uniref:S8 family serine peptidase n=1 Tax=Streptacidiphilus cavernicola TaxID=3342716 RepID=A0ABV6UIL8_9ACTN|nr:S8 family serine peptidase [Streptacidiphilus jeojiense]